jgi:hypothetical protein
MLKFFSKIIEKRVDSAMRKHFDQRKFIESCAVKAAKAEVERSAKAENIVSLIAGEGIGNGGNYDAAINKVISGRVRKYYTSKQLCDFLCISMCCINGLVRDGWLRKFGRDKFTGYDVVELIALRERHPDFTWVAGDKYINECTASRLIGHNKAYFKGRRKKGLKTVPWIRLGKRIIMYRKKDVIAYKNGNFGAL